jgi:hypothetical protein
VTTVADMQATPPPLKTPKRVYGYIAILFGLPLLYVIAGVSSSGSAHPIVRELQTLRWFVFALCALCYATAGLLFLKRRASGRLLIIVVLLAHFAYVLYHNLRLLFQNGSPMALEMVGLVSGIAIMMVCFLTFGVIPFTRKFSLYLGATGRSGPPGGENG